MSIFDYFRSHRNQQSASIAKERLQIIVAHERGSRNDFLLPLQQELLSVIAKYVPIDQDQVKVELDRSGHCSVLELNITLPSSNETTTA